MPIHGQASQTKPIELKAVSFLPPFVPTVKSYKAFIEEINSKSKGELSIKYIGGPEAVSMFDQVGAVRSGVIDMTWIPTTMYTGFIPGAEGYGLSRVTPLEERKSGAYDLFATRTTRVD